MGRWQAAPAASPDSRLPPTFEGYHEPFLGGGALFFALRRAGAGEAAVLADRNGGLIGTYRVVRDRPADLTRLLGEMEATYLAATDREAAYRAVRASRPHEATAAAARFLFLNRTAFNGLYRENRRGEFNVPHGRYANPRIRRPPSSPPRPQRSKASA